MERKYLRRTRKLLETKLYYRNLIKGISTWAGPLLRYSGPFLKWAREELKHMDLRKRKLMNMYEALNPRDDVDRLYVSRKNEEEDLPALNTALTHQYKDWKTTKKSVEEA